MENDFTYYAFISYSHKDQKWAEWIQRSIEHYKLPAIIRKESQKPLPKRIAPVFRDVTDLGVDVLVDGLHEELEKSRFLIVVCSPNSAAPNAEGKHFVDEEVRHFCELGREKQIIPVIIEGTPQESFGPVLKSKEILALDATKQSKDRILNDIVAKILGLKPDSLWRRVERERRKRRIIMSTLYGILASLVAFAGYFFWDASRTVENYYADYVDSFGLPEGIFPLKKSDLTHRYIHYRFEYRGFQYGKSPHADSADWCIWNWFGFRRRLVRVVQANSRGYPRKWDDSEFSVRPQIQDFKYENLRLSEISYGLFNGSGKVPHMEKRIELWNLDAEESKRIWGFNGVITNGLIKCFLANGQLGFSYHRSHETSLELGSAGSKDKSDIVNEVVMRDNNGRVLQLLFMNLSGDISKDGDGVCGFSFLYDAKGRKTSESSIVNKKDGLNLNVANRIIGSGKIYEWFGHNLRKIKCVDDNGAATIGVMGYKVRNEKYDEYDRCVEVYYCDEKGNMVSSPGEMEWGYSKCVGYKKDYDLFGNQIRQVFFDAQTNMTSSTCSQKLFAETIDDPLTPERTWNLAVIVETEYDDNGNKMSEKYLDIDGKQMPGVAEVRWEYDACGNKIKESYFMNDFPVMTLSGFSEVCLEYDKRKNITQRSFFNTEKELTSYCGRFAVERIEYDDHDHELRRTFLDVDELPCTNGIAEIRMKYDKRGNMIRIAYFDSKGHPTENQCGNVETCWNFYESGNVKQSVTFSIDGDEHQYLYDEFGHFHEERYFDSSRKRVFYVAMIETVLSKGYNNGFKAGDIVLAYNQWDFLNMPLIELHEEIAKIKSIDVNSRLVIARQLRNEDYIIELHEISGNIDVLFAELKDEKIERRQYNSIISAYKRWIEETKSLSSLK